MTGLVISRWYGTASLTALAALGVAAVFAAVPPQYALAGAVLIAGTFAVYRLPVLSLSALAIVGIGPTVFYANGQLQFNPSILFGKASLADVIMTAMMLSVFFKAAWVLARPWGQSRNFPVALVVCYGALFAWIAVSVLRNLDTYGIRAAGQFRYSYLLLAVPAYAAIFLRSPTQRRRFCVFLLVFSVALPLAAVPVVGFMKGWGIGPSSRFFLAPVSLGLLYGWATLLLASERGVLRAPKWLARGLAFPVAALLLVDGHRSVWLAGLVLIVYFLLAERLSAGTAARMSVLAAAVASAVVALTGMVGLSVWNYVATRGSALINPEGDATSSWRLELWSLSLARWRRHPLAGDGFGGYYGGNAGLGVATTIQPHSYYVQTLVSMGAIGLALLVGVFVATGVTLWRARKRQRKVDHESLDTILVEVGLGILLSSLAYSIVYSVEYYSCLWVGLAVAAALGWHHSQERGTVRSD